ncbi:MAG: long-chain fatty acid--CoA ligase [Actinobacteria bacterium]|nr:long-chain fatty acid--CoA ligase [Actinomycetota bacterium]
MNLSDLLSFTATRLPDKPALVFRDRPITYRELDERASLAAAAFASAGVRPGDRVAVILGNVPEFVYALHGAFRAGAVAVPLNVMLTSEELGYILADAGARLAVVGMSHLSALLAVRDRLQSLERIQVVTGPPVPPGTESFEEALGRAGDAPEVAVGDDDLAVLQYTSGTTAHPKGAMLTHRNLLSNLDQMEAVPALAGAERDVVLLVLPLFHIYALNVVLGITIRHGATAVLVSHDPGSRFDPAGTLDLVERHRITALFGAPPMFRGWLALDDGRERDLSSVRIAVSGAAPLPGEVLEGFRERYGVTIWEGYGLTETAPAVTTNALGPEARPDSIGLPLPGVEVRLVDDDGDDVEEGDPGEIVVRGPNVFLGYWGREDETARAIQGGWLRTGDVAYRDEDGYLYLVDRKKDLVIVSGFNVYPREVEEALLRHPAVSEAAAIGVPDERTGEAVRVSVVLHPGARASPDELIDHAAGLLARFKVPREVEIVPELPRHATGKLLRRALRGEEVLGRGEEV